MKIRSTILLLTLFAFSNIYSRPPAPIRKIYDLTISLFGTDKFEPRKEAFIRDIITELGMSQEIQIYKMNNLALEIFGPYNAMAIFDSVIISEDLFRIYTKDELRFTVGHELMHIKKLHMPLNISFQIGHTAGNIVLYKAISAKWLCNISDKYLQRISKALTAIGLFSSQIWLKNRIAHACELQADREAAIRLNVIDGGINSFKRFMLPAHLAPKKKLADKVEDLLWAIFYYSHPEDAERIAQLEALKTYKTAH